MPGDLQVQVLKREEQLRLEPFFLQMVVTLLLAVLAAELEEVATTLDFRESSLAEEEVPAEEIKAVQEPVEQEEHMAVEVVEVSMAYGIQLFQQVVQLVNTGERAVIAVKMGRTGLTLSGWIFLSLVKEQKALS